LFALFLIIPTLTPRALFAQEEKAILNFVKTSHDFGVIKEDGGSVFVDFQFVNNGKGPLIIHRVITSCDCAVADWPKEPIVPGANGSIRVVFNPKDRVGRFEKMITIYSNAIAPTSVLQINGTIQEKTRTVEDIFNRVIGDFRFKNVHVAFGRVFLNEVKVDTLEFIYTGNEPVKIGAKLVNSTFLMVKIIPEILKTNEKGLIVVSYDAKLRNDWGFVIDRFMLTQNDKDVVNSLITVTATIEENFTDLNDAQRANAPKIEMLVQNFDFGEVSEGDLLEKEFTFTNVGKSDLIIRKIKASCGCTTVEPADKVIKPGKSSSFKASIRTNGFKGKIAKTVTIITNDPSNPSVVIRMTAVVNLKNN